MQELLTQLRDAGAPELLSEHVAHGHYNDKRGDFHQHPSCKAIPRAGNWILAQMGVLLVQGVCGTATNSTTYGTCIETWLFKVSQLPDFAPMLDKLAETIATLQSLMEGIPTAMREQVQWAGTESKLQTLLQEYFPYPITGIDITMGEPEKAPIDISDDSGSQNGEGPIEKASSSAAPRHKIMKATGEPAERWSRGP